jgi:hypothetical protein
VCRRVGGTKRVRREKEIITFSYEIRNENNQLRTGFNVNHRIVSAFKRIEFVSDRISYTAPRGCWCNIIVLNVHAPCVEKSDGSKDSFYEELEQVFFSIFLNTV